ncbi:MAG TPA: ABC transporter permease, partial [Anaerolineae bacterium]|nr:ABC transporter permease [Anaerolineae bacterium]
KLRLQSSSAEIVILILALVLIMAVASIATPGFLTYKHITMVLYVNTMFGILSLAQTLVILSGGLDLSVGSIYWISTMIGALLMVKGDTLFPALACLLIGAVIGIINGTAIAKLKVPHVVMTLAMMIILTGVLYVTTGGGGHGRATEQLISFSTGRIFEFPIISMVWILLSVLFYFILKITPFGWRIRALGSNPVASRCSGIQVQRIQIAVYMLSGLLAALAGLLYLGWARTPYPTFQSGAGVGADLTLKSVAAVVIGGTLFSGGRGGVERTFLGVLILSILYSILIMAGLGVEWQIMLNGVIIISVVGVYSQAKTR